MAKWRNGDIFDELLERLEQEVLLQVDVQGNGSLEGDESLPGKRRSPVVFCVASRLISDIGPVSFLRARVFPPSRVIPNAQDIFALTTSTILMPYFVLDSTSGFTLLISGTNTCICTYTDMHVYFSRSSTFITSARQCCGKLSVR